MNTRNFSLLAVACLIGGVALYTACGDDDDGVKDTGLLPDGGKSSSSSSSSTGGLTNPDAGGSEDTDGGNCFHNPTTNFEIINGCTDAQRITRDVVPSKLYPDGGLPPDGL